MGQCLSRLKIKRWLQTLTAFLDTLFDGWRGVALKSFYLFNFSVTNIGGYFTPKHNSSVPFELTLRETSVLQNISILIYEGVLNTLSSISIFSIL